jgi:nucleoside-diphosphate-sugar epimerase
MGHAIPADYRPWRPGDQRAFYADVTKARHELGWEPSVTLETGLRRLFAWVKEHHVAMQ